jgi:hypothetical protein
MRSAAVSSGEPARRAGGGRMGRGVWAWCLAVAAAAAAVVPSVTGHLAGRDRGRRVEDLLAGDALRAAAAPAGSASGGDLPAPTLLAERARRLGPLLASWQTIGGCGAGGGGSAGGVKWVGRNTRGGLFQALIQTSYVRIPYSLAATDDGGYTLTTTMQFGRELNDRASVGVIIPLVYKYYKNVGRLATNPADVSNGGLGDVFLVGTFRFGPINATSVTLGLGFPTGEHAAHYKGSYLTNEKQLGPGNFNGTATVDHVFDEIWGLFLVGGSVGLRGGQNDITNYRAPMASAYSHVGYFLGPFVPAAGLTLTAWKAKDRDQGVEQNVPLSTLAPSASIEWSNDYLALLAGVSLPWGMTTWGGTMRRQPWVASVGMSISPF